MHRGKVYIYCNATVGGMKNETLNKAPPLVETSRQNVNNDELLIEKKFCRFVN